MAGPAIVTAKLASDSRRMKGRTRPPCVRCETRAPRLGGVGGGRRDLRCHCCGIRHYWRPDGPSSRGLAIRPRTGRLSRMEMEQLVSQLRARRPSAVARAISIVENGRPGFEAILSTIFPYIGSAARIGITGPPGAGKSTLTERLAMAWRASGRTVAVVAVDPTSPFTGGALLGDRIRMESLTLDDGVFIRSMATRG